MRSNRTFLALLANALWSLCVLGADTNRAAATAPPNVILIVADDLGYGDLGCYGQKKILTPNLDRLAAGGLRFTQCYAGSTVCAPSRCSLMTGKHTGHAAVRGNVQPELPLPADEFCLAQVFKSAGYATVLIGKWGLGGNETSGAPNRKGFDYFFGYPSQTAAHNYYPEFLWRNAEKFVLEGNQGGKRGTYAHDLFMQEALAFIRTNQSRPFFLELAVTIPHANNEEKPNGMQVPSDAPYAQENWPQVEKNFAAMITRLDAGVGQVVALLTDLGIDQRTLVIFTSDNGPHAEGGHAPGFFSSSGPLRGIKRDLYEGGIRVPMIARWPGRIKAGAVSPQVVALWDYLPTFADLVGQPAPKNLDGISMLPAMMDNKSVAHPPLYWECYERGFSRAVRMADWKGVSLGPNQPLELYDLSQDISERTNVAAEHPEIIRQIESLMKQEHVPSPIWSNTGTPAATKKKQNTAQ